MNNTDIEEIKNHLADIAGFFSALYAFRIIDKSHPIFKQLDEIAKRNKILHDKLDTTT